VKINRASTLPGPQWISGDRGMKNSLGTSGDQWPILKRWRLVVLGASHSQPGLILIFAEINQQNPYSSLLVRAGLTFIGFSQLFM
jgi:hypothetical protein